MFPNEVVLHIPCQENEETNELAKHARWYIEIPSEFIQEEYLMEICLQVVDYWIKELVDYLNDSSTSANFKLKQNRINYILNDGDLYKKGCIGFSWNAYVKRNLSKIIDKVHEGAFLDLTGLVESWNG